MHLYILKIHVLMKIDTPTYCNVEVILHVARNCDKYAVRDISDSQCLIQHYQYVVF